MKKIFGFLKKQALWLSLGLVILVMGLGVYLVNAINKKNFSMKEEIKKKYTEIQNYERDKANAPSAELISRLRKEKEALATAFQVMMTKFSTSFPSPPTYRDFPSIEFKEFLLATQDSLQKRAKRKQVSLPASLSQEFPETGLVSPDQVGPLSLKLEVVKKLIELMIDSGVTMVNNIKPEDARSEAFYRVMPVQVAITGTSMEIIRFLKFLENPSSFFIVETFALRQGSGGLFSATLSLNAYMFETTKAEAPVTPPVQVGSQPQG
ncbi:MAG: Amuc_1100 family pilus-like protein [Candidatus Omnitrophica bacterium]|nr:Amuc_1100 family pilus-like protein [Candidatus Omnitrophota bacterium]